MSPIEKIDREIKRAQDDYAAQMAKIKAIEVRLSELRRERERADYLVRMGAGEIYKPKENGMKYVLLLVALLGSSVAWADEACEHCTLDEVLVTAYTVPMKYSETGKVVTRLDDYLFTTQKPVALDDVLVVEGVDVKTTGGLPSVQIRGNRSQDTRLTVNGIELRDPSEISGGSASMIGDTLLDGFDSAEIVKGASSTLYGSDGIGGSIGLQPKKESYASFEYGNHSSFKESFGYTIQDFYVNATRLDSDDYGNTQMNAGYTWKNDRITLEPFILVRQVDADLYDSPFLMGGQFVADSRDENDRREYETYHFANKASLEFGDTFTLTNKTSWTSQDRRFLYLMDSDGSDFPYDIEYRGDTLQVTNILSNKATDNLTLSFGEKTTKEFMEIEVRDINEDEADQYRNDLFAEAIYQWNVLTLQGAVRGNFPENTDPRLTYETSINAKIKPIRIHGSFSTGYRQPSLYEQYGTLASSFGRFEIGNTELSPERSNSFDGGIEYQDDLNTAGLNFFINDIDNMIDFVGMMYENVDGERRTHGFEGYYERFLLGCLSARVGFTHQDSNRVGVPDNKVYGSLSAIKGKWNGRFLVQWTDSKEYSIFNADTFLFENASEDGSVNASLTVGYQVKENVEVYGRIENLFDDTYTQDGFNQDGFGAFAGVKVKL